MLGCRLVEKEKTTVSGRGRCHTINRATSPRTRAKVSLIKAEGKKHRMYLMLALNIRSVMNLIVVSGAKTEKQQLVKALLVR